MPQPAEIAADQRQLIQVMRPSLGTEEAAAAASVVESGWLVQGPKVAEFERVVADAVGAAHGVAVTSCTAALHLALVVLGLGEGDDVVVPSLSFIATANAPRYVGATPVFADVDATCHNLTPATIEEALTESTKAVIVVHQGGMPADVSPIREMCAAREVAVVEDAACAIGSTYRGAPVGAGAALAAFSFHPRKLITTGEGGMVLTDSEAWAERLRRLRDHGSNASASERHRSTKVNLESYLETGFNYRMTDIQAAIGLVQMGRLAQIVAQRRWLASRYQDALARVPGISVASDPPWGETNYQAFWITLAEDFPLERDALLEALLDERISARRGIMAAHLEPAYADHPHRPLPVTESLTSRSLILPLHHEMGEDEVSRVVGVIERAAAPARG